MPDGQQKPEKNNVMKKEIQRVLIAAVIPMLLLFVMYMIKVLEAGMEWDFSRLGVYPLEKKGIFGIFAHPFIHSGFRHLFANTFPFLFLAWCLFYFYKDIASYIFWMIWVLCGVLTFFIGKPGWHIGASGIIYGLMFFLLLSGMLRRYIPLIAISLLVAFLYGGLVWNMFPAFAKVTTSWEGHLSGAVAGSACALLFRSYGPQKPEAFEEEEEEGSNSGDEGEDSGEML